MSSILETWIKGHATIYIKRSTSDITCFIWSQKLYCICHFFCTSDPSHWYLRQRFLPCILIFIKQNIHWCFYGSRSNCICSYIGLGINWCTDVMFMMQPPFGSCCFSICFTASLLHMKGPVRSTARIFCQRSIVVSSRGTSCCTPALFTKTSILPYFMMVWSINRTQSASLEISAPIGIESQPNALISSETAWASCNFLAWVTTANYSPDLANAMAMALPIPLLDPVTTPIFLFISHSCLT